MTEELTLNSRQLRRMLDLLLKEKEALRKHLFWFHVHKITFYILVVSAMLLGLGMVSKMPDWRSFSAVAVVLYNGSLVLFQVAFFILAPLFLINLRFALALRRHDRMREALGFDSQLHALLHSPYRKRRILLFVMILSLTIGLATALSGMELLFNLESFTVPRILDVVFTPICVLTVALSMPVLWWTARGEDRLRQLSELRDRLEAKSREDETQTDFQVSVIDYDRVARLEKERGLRERAASIRRGRKLARERIFAIQRSEETERAVYDLDVPTRMAVERVIFGLMSKPEPKKASPFGEEGLHKLRVPKTPISLIYEVDDPGERVRIHWLEIAGAVEAHGLGAGATS